MNGPIKPGQMEFTRADFDRYKAEIAEKGYDKIIDEGGMLSEQDVEYLKSMRQELWQRFTPASLDEYNPVGCINSILSLDGIRKQHLWEKELEKECKDLESKLSRGRADRTITKEEEKRMSRRRDEICYRLDPTHFHGPPPY